MMSCRHAVEDNTNLPCCCVVCTSLQNWASMFFCVVIVSELEPSRNALEGSGGQGVQKSYWVLQETKTGIGAIFSSWTGKAHSVDRSLPSECLPGFLPMHNLS